AGRYVPAPDGNGTRCLLTRDCAFCCSIEPRQTEGLRATIHIPTFVRVIIRAANARHAYVIAEPGAERDRHACVDPSARKITATRKQLQESPRQEGEVANRSAVRGRGWTCRQSGRIRRRGVGVLPRYESAAKSGA